MVKHGTSQNKVDRGLDFVQKPRKFSEAFLLKGRGFDFFVIVVYTIMVSIQYKRMIRSR